MTTKIKQCIRAIEIIINDFLEPDVTIDELKGNKGLMESLRSIFESSTFFNKEESDTIRNLLSLNHPPKGEKFTNIIKKPLFLDDWPKKEKQALEDKLIKSKGQMIQIWLKINNAANKKRRDPPPYISHREELCKFQIDLISSHNQIQFGADEIVLKFIVLLNNLPFNLFRYCSDNNCGKWFVSNRSDKKFCSKKCSNRTRQKRLKSKDPEKYLQDHRDYAKKKYEEKCEKEREEKWATQNTFKL